MSARLVGWIEGSGRLDRELTAETRVGATPDNEVVVRVDGVSRQHAKITSEADGFWIEDKSSRNGTWINGDRTTRSKLRHLDVITFGRFAEFIFVARDGEMPAAAPGLALTIEWLNGPSAGQRIEIPHGETILGRAESCGVVVNDGSVSRAHARLTHTGDSVSIEDLGSINGTLMNGQPLTSAVEVEADAEVEIGDRRFRVLLEGQGARPVAAMQGATPTAAQDVEWMTRLVWSESDLEAVRGAAAAAGVSRPASSKSRPAAPAPRPGAPPPSASAPEPADAPPVAPPVPQTQVAHTELGSPTFDAPPPAAAAGLGVPGTIVAAPGTFALPDFAGGAPPTVPPTAFEDRTQSSDDPMELPTDLRGPAKPQMPRPVASGPARSSADRPDLPMSTVLGYRDVAPTARPGTSSGIELPPSDAALRADAVGLPLRAVRLSGSVGSFELPLGSATIGRSEQATLRIESRDVSRIHAVLTITEHEAVLEDRGSINGTMLNATRLKGSLPLSHGDRVAFADFEFLVEFLRAEAKP